MTGFIQLFYREGYVDNRPDDTTFDISHAVDTNRQPIDLDFVDFVRIYCATNQQYPIIGETSTELRIAEDLHLDASIEAITNATANIIELDLPSTPIHCYDLTGRSVTPRKPGMYIVNGKKLLLK